MSFPVRAAIVISAAVALLGAGTGPPAASAVTGAPEEPRGVWPLRPQPDVVGDFDPPENPYGRGHRGVDLAGSAGQPVRAAMPGTVSWTGQLAGVGIVVVDHGPTRTTYQPVVAAPPVGTQVAAGDHIGRLARPGSHCFPGVCLHWGWRRGEVYLDPLALVGYRPVRLLPLTGTTGLSVFATRAGPGGMTHPYAAWRPPLVAWRPHRRTHWPGFPWFRTGWPRLTGWARLGPAEPG